jgi:hypothetical protein
MEIANVFWRGDLTKLEMASVKSLIDCGFHVKFWSYDNIQIDGTESCDAKLVMPEEEYFNHIPSDEEITPLKKARATSFSDVFRYYLLNKFDGWWFDLDVICLKSVEEFKKLKNRNIVAGKLYHDNDDMNGAVLYMTKELSTTLINDFEIFINNQNVDRKWASYGPHYLTNFLKTNNLIDEVLPKHYFYSINWVNFYYFADPNLKENAREMLKDSYVAHIWNTEFALMGLDKNNVIPESIIDEYYKKYNV